MIYDLADYEDFKMRYDKYDLEFMIENLKDFITSDYINKFYRINSPLALIVIKKLEERLKSVKKIDEEGFSFKLKACDYNISTAYEIVISFTYEEIITLRYYLSTLDLKDKYSYRRRDGLVRDLDEYIGKHKAWLDFRRITKEVDAL